MPGLKDRISADLKEAMKAGDAVRREALRSVLSGFSYRRIEAGHELSETEELEVIQKAVKQRNDSIAEFARGNRPELVEKETRERDILLTYLPAQKSEDEIRALVRQALASLPEGGRNQGAAMKAVMPQLRGLADGKLVNRIVAEELKN
ncbi:MAG: GatB/YqeY domain-containing protein [Candidatus Eremiobacteraeota bacterium]|nr:GatB/YqeY domain-containing protein [Candidatus Eremiobacteraeota bacterium]MBV8355360.1 GatB/YqeY domain-containing protein [Candidatus Eremiobacteraeota bacterium]